MTWYISYYRDIFYDIMQNSWTSNMIWYWVWVHTQNHMRRGTISFYNNIHDIVHKSHLYHIWYHSPLGSQGRCLFNLLCFHWQPSGSNHALTVLRPFPSLCCPYTVLADTKAPDPPSLCNQHHPGAALTITPHPDAPLIQSAVIAQIPLCLKLHRLFLKRSKSGVTVAANEELNELGSESLQHVWHWADANAGQLLVAGWVIEHVHSSSLQHCLWSDQWAWT